MKYQIYLPLEKLSKGKLLSERSLALAANISRVCLRHLKEKNSNLTLASICSVANFFNRKVEVVISNETTCSEFSTVATAYKVERDGFDSWKIHFMDLVDEFRRSLDSRLILLPPMRAFDIRLTALLASLVKFLCEEVDMPTPHWATKHYYLENPWFLSGIESLKAMAILESPLAFRSNNIFVHENFTDRA